MWENRIVKDFFRENKAEIFFALAVGTTFFSGFFSGRFFEKLVLVDLRPPVEIFQDAGDRATLLHLQKIENGILHGESQGQPVRFFIGQDREKAAVFTVGGGEFQVPMIEILPMLQKMPAPDWAKFVGSRRGSTFWPLDAPEAFLFSAKNRIFFKSEGEARAKGFKRGG